MDKCIFTNVQTDDYHLRKTAVPNSMSNEESQYASKTGLEMGRVKTESENESNQTKACKASDKDSSSNTQMKSDAMKPIENDKNSSSKKKDEEDGEKTSSSADVQAGVTSKQDSSSSVAKGDNQADESQKEKTGVAPTPPPTPQQTMAARGLPEVVVKRGRGRPRKNPEKVEPPKPKRGRGRPPKSLSQKLSCGPKPGFASLSASGGRKVSSEQLLEVIVKNESFNDYDNNKDQKDENSYSAVNGDMAARRKSRNLPFRKSKRRSIPRINLEDFEDDSEDEPVRKKRLSRPKRFPPSGPRLKISTPSTSKKHRETEQHLTSQVDRLASLVDRLENRINLDGLVDEDTDIETDLEDDAQVLLLQRNYNVKNELKRDFKDIVKTYIGELGAESGCLIASTRSYRNSGKFTVYEIWNADSDQLMFISKSNNKIFGIDINSMLRTSAVVKTMNIPASWWQKCS